MPKTQTETNTPNTLRGTVVDVKLDADRRFGFIQLDAGGPDIFFHADALADGLDFNEQLIERRVEVVDCKTTQRGRRAGVVRPLG